MITLQEVADLIGKENFNETTNTYDKGFSLSSDYKWLFNSTNSGYWTATYAATTLDCAWTIRSGGLVDYCDTNLHNCPNTHGGIRPVITVPIDWYRKIIS